MGGLGKLGVAAWPEKGIAAMRAADQNCTRKRRRLGATSTEYMLVLALVVIPIGLLLPTFVNSLKIYSERMDFVIRLPFP
jgi:hypothetical protein